MMATDWNQLVPTRQSLLSRLKNLQDQQSWQEFFDVYSPLIHAAALKAGASEADANDIVQETVIAVCKAIPSFKYDASRARFKTWLHAITRRQVANQFRKRRSGMRLLEPLPDCGVDGGYDIPDPAGAALDQHWEREWEQNLLEGALRRLKSRISPAQYQIYEFHVVQGHSVLETARVTGVSPGRVYLAKHRVSAELRREIDYLKQNTPEPAGRSGCR